MTPAAPPPADPADGFDPAAFYGENYRQTGPVTIAAGGFSGAGVTRVPTAAGSFALRVWPAVPPPLDRLRGLHALLERAAAVDPDLPVAVPVRAAGGETLIRLHGRLAQLEPWLPGAPLPAGPSAGELTAAATALARFHAAAAGFEPPAAARPYFAGSPAAAPPSLTARRDRLARWLSGGADRAAAILDRTPPSEFRELSRELLARLKTRGPALLADPAFAADTAVPLSPVLRDVHREHILMEESGVTGLIDPSAALADAPAADLARLATSLAGNRLHELLAAYETARPLAPAERRLAPPLAASGALLSGLAWVARGTWEGADAATDPAAVARMRRFAGWGP